MVSSNFQMETNSSHTASIRPTIAEHEFDEYESASPTVSGVAAEISDFGDLPPLQTRSSPDPLPSSVNSMEAPHNVNDHTRRVPRRSNTHRQRSALAQAADLKRTKSDESSIVQGNVRRNSTMYTEASASFDDTAVWDGKAILSLDGGGIRGYSALLIIRALMRAIGKIERSYPAKSDTSDGPAESSYHPLSPFVTATTDSDSVKSSEPTDAPVTDTSPWLPCHYFDYVAGTSTGGLIGIMIGRLRMNIDDCIRDYETLGGKVFGRSRWFHLRTLPPFFFLREKYDHKVLQDVVQDVVRKRIPKVSDFPGGQNFAFDENRCRVVVVAYQENQSGGAGNPYLFRTYKNLHRSEDPKEKILDRNPGPAHDIPIWEVARATSAAPTYFKPPKIDHREYLDGGFGDTNNPSVEIYDEVRRMNNHSNKCISILISIGTGKNNKISRWTKHKLPGSKYTNYMNFAKAWASQSETQHGSMTKEWKKFKFVYERLNVEAGLDTMKLDEWDTTGRIRVALGKCIGKATKWSTKQHFRGQATKSLHAAKSQEKSREDEDEDSASSSSEEETLRADKVHIPRWFQSRTKTLDKIRERTELYLATPKVQKQIENCAKILVEGRRGRAKKDIQRWEKVCFSAWYQCKVDECPRGEKEYVDRKKLRNHLLDKHRDIYKQVTAQDEETLNTALDSFKIVIH